MLHKCILGSWHSTHPNHLENRCPRVGDIPKKAVRTIQTKNEAPCIYERLYQVNAMYSITTNTGVQVSGIQKKTTTETPTYAQHAVPNDKCTHKDKTNGNQEDDGGNHSDRFKHLYKETYNERST